MSLGLSLSLEAASLEKGKETQVKACQGSWREKISCRFKQIWYQGKTDLYFSGYAWHNRYTYAKEKLSSFNELAWGGGFGKGFYDEDGDWHSLSAIAFLDSHKHIEPAAGYAFFKIKPLTQDLRLGLGYSILITQREDILSGYPFPGVLPWLSVNYKALSLMTTYIPGSMGAGNVLYILGRWSLDA